MEHESYRFKIGSFECICVSDGIREYPYDPIDWLYPDAPKEPLYKALREQGIEPEGWEQWVSDYTCLAINTGRHQVLVDTGDGNVLPTTGKLLPRLKAEGIEPEDIDIVIITHAHPDHIGGNTNREGKPAFPKARYVMWKGEWEFWHPEPDLSDLDVPEDAIERLLRFVRDFLPPIRDQLDLIDHDKEIVPGVYGFSTAGHTPGHMAVAVSSGDEKLLVVGDALIQPINVEHPEWNARVDMLKEQAVASRHQLLLQAAADKALVHGFHFPFPCLGYITSEEGAWKWHPMKTTD